MALRLHDFWGHPAWRAADCVVLLSLLHLGRHSEVGQKYFTFHVEQNVASFYISVNFSVRVQVFQAVHRLTYNCSYDGLISYATRSRLRLKHVHNVSASASIDDLHDNPKEVGTDEGYMLRDNVPMTRRIHDGTLPTQLPHRRVFELGAVDDFYRYSLACMLPFKALGSPDDTKVAHTNNDL